MKNKAGKLQRRQRWPTTLNLAGITRLPARVAATATSGMDTPEWPRWSSQAEVREVSFAPLTALSLPALSSLRVPRSTTHPPLRGAQT